MILFIAHSAATLYMTGLIWFVQLVHYPLHGHVGSDAFLEYQAYHVQWTGLAVGPAMLIEAVGALLLVVTPPLNIPSWQLWLGLALVIVIWASTAFLQVPLHNTLQQSFDSVAHKQLVGTNWIRTLAWSARAILILVIQWQLMEKSL
ncbi:MAG: hypothetical protein ACON4U_17240 [Myxococcota bacterium]